ncbi:hypothetical protein COBT_001835 [Conglomerata obtusa]
MIYMKTYNGIKISKFLVKQLILTSKYLFDYLNQLHLRKIVLYSYCANVNSIDDKSSIYCITYTQIENKNTDAIHEKLAKIRQDFISKYEKTKVYEFLIFKKHESKELPLIHYVCKNLIDHVSTYNFWNSNMKQLIESMMQDPECRSKLSYYSKKATRLCDNYYAYTLAQFYDKIAEVYKSISDIFFLEFFITLLNEYRDLIILEELIDGVRLNKEKNEVYYESEVFNHFIEALKNMRCDTTKIETEQIGFRLGYKIESQKREIILKRIFENLVISKKNDEVQDEIYVEYKNLLSGLNDKIEFYICKKLTNTFSKNFLIIFLDISEEKLFNRFTQIKRKIKDIYTNKFYNEGKPNLLVHIFCKFNNELLLQTQLKKNFLTKMLKTGPKIKFINLENLNFESYYSKYHKNYNGLLI